MARDLVQRRTGVVTIQGRPAACEDAWERDRARALFEGRDRIHARSLDEAR